MKKIEMGVYYKTANGMVKTIGKAIDARDNTTMIIYATLVERGYVDKTMVLPEEQFAEMLD
jgi:hypothetical protein